MDPVQFDQLPYLCLKKIFSFLNLRDLTTCRAVSRQFKAYAEETRVDELVVGEDSVWYQCQSWCQSWYQTGKPIDYKCSISPKAFASYLESSPFKLDQQLKFLHLHHHDRSDIRLEILSEFKQLRHLELRGVGGSRTLILPNLKVLDVRGYTDASYVLKTPKLEVLVCRNISSIHAEHPETIKQIEFDCECSGSAIDLASFKNLQILICNCWCHEDSDVIRLSNWKDLKELRILPNYWRRDSTFKDVQSSLVNLMRQRTESKREDLKLYVDEVLLVDAKQFEDHRAWRDLFRMKYYRLLRCDTYPNVTSVHFNELMNLNVELSSDFFDRFPRIQRLTASGPVDRDRFEWFLQNAPAVRELTLLDTSLDSAFMNRLAQINGRLTSLKVYQSPGLTADLNFVLQFKQLTEFATTCELDSFDLVAKAFRQLNELQSFHFRASSSKYVHIGRDSLKNDYYLSISSVRNEAQIIFQKNLDWAQLVALYDQERDTATPPVSDEDDFY